MELLVETPSLLKEGHIVHFSEGWRDNWSGRKGDPNGGYFRVTRAQQMEYDVNRIVAPGNAAGSNYQDISFEAPNQGGVSDSYISLLPANGQTLYELLIGIKGMPFIYPRYANRWQLQLEEMGCYPDLTDATYLMYLGFYDYTKSPYFAPKIREYTVKDTEPPHLYLWNPYQDDEKIVLCFTVNRCFMERTTPSEAEKRVAREVNYYTKYLW